MSDILSSQGIVIALKKYGETSAILDIFSEQAGLVRGYAKGALLKKNVSIYQKGNLIAFEHTRTLPHQLGYITAEPILCLWAELSGNRFSFAAFTMICDLFLGILPYGVAETALYTRFISLLDILRHSSHEDSAKEICFFLLYFLQISGYSPDIYRCAVTGTQHNLLYVSPNTGKAVCRDIGYPYHTKLLKLPPFLSNADAHISKDDLQDGLKLMGFLIEKFLFYPSDKTLPQSYMQFLKLI